MPCVSRVPVEKPSLRAEASESLILKMRYVHVVRTPILTYQATNKAENYSKKLQEDIDPRIGPGDCLDLNPRCPESTPAYQLLNVSTLDSGDETAFFSSIANNDVVLIDVDIWPLLDNMGVELDCRRLISC